MKTTVVLELIDPDYRRVVNLGEEKNRKALDETESRVLGRYCNEPIANGGTYGSYDIELIKITNNEIIFTTNDDSGEVSKAFGKYAADFTHLGKYRVVTSNIEGNNESRLFSRKY